MSYDFSTLKVQVGYRTLERNYAVSVPICQATALALGDSYRADRLFSFLESNPIYTRFSNPTVNVLEKRAVALHGVSDAIALASGMVVVSYVLSSTTGKGGRVLATARLHGGTVDSLGHLFPELGAKIDFVKNPDHIEEFEEKLASGTKTILTESLTNPFATIPDFEVIARTAHAYEILLVVDNTMTTPYLFNPLEHDVDIVVYSATRAPSDHGNVVAGLMLGSGTFDYDSGDYSYFEKLLWFLHDEHDEPCSILQVFSQSLLTGRLRAIHLNYPGAVLSPFDAYLMLIGLETLSERVAKQVSNALVVLEYPEQNEYVLWVRYPYAQGSRYHVLAGHYFPKGAGFILSFGLRGTEEQKRAFLVSIEMLGYQANIGDAHSLTIDPVQTTYVELTEGRRLLVGPEVSTIYLSPGLENPKDLIEDLRQTFDSVFQD